MDISLNNSDDLPEALKLAEDIFQPNEAEKIKYHNPIDWKRRMDNGLLVLARKEDIPVGFAISYEKEGALHIWNVGVLEEYRRLGIWKAIYEAIMRFAKENNYKKVTINTFKEKFPGMYNFLINNEFVEYKTEIDQLSGNTKSLFEKNI